MAGFATRMTLEREMPKARASALIDSPAWCRLAVAARCERQQQIAISESSLVKLRPRPFLNAAVIDEPLVAMYSL